jgi:hypothetical protein
MSRKNLLSRILLVYYRLIRLWVYSVNLMCEGDLVWSTTEQLFYLMQGLKQVEGSDLCLSL